MRLAGFLLVVVATSTAYADPLPFEIVRMLPETHQVLVYDPAHNTHVLLQPGSKFDDYVIVEVSGLDLVVEKKQQRFTLYPREARYLSLNLFPRTPTQLPIIFGKSAPAPAKKPIDVAAQTMRELALLPTRPRLSSKLRP